MEKVSKAILEACNGSTCLSNELVVLPQNGEVGFEEYFAHKTREVIRAKKLFTNYDLHHLMLAYPAPDAKEHMVFERFFESPFVVARNHAFQGCFGIDISAYINKQQDAHFLELLSYIKSNPSMVFTLFMYSANVREIEAMHDFLLQYMEIRRVDISLPTPEELTEYTISHIRDFSLHVHADVDDSLGKYYAKYPVGYEAADYIVRKLQKMHYQGDLQTVQEVLESMPKGMMKVGAAGGFGY